LESPEEEVVMEREVFIVDPDDQALANVSVKVNTVGIGSQSEKYQRFVQTDEDGKLVLPAHPSDYVLYISEKGFAVKKYRIPARDARRSHLVRMQAAISCIEVKGVIIDGVYNFPVKSVSIRAQSTHSGKQEQTYSNREGTFSLCLEADQTYQLEFAATAYQAKSERLFLNEEEARQQPLKIYLSPKQEQTEVVSSTVLPKVNSSPRQSPAASQAVNQKVEQHFPYHVIVGTFSKKANAEKRLAEAKQLGYQQAHIIQYIDTGMFGVSIGDFPKMTQADDLKRRSKLKAIIKKI
ncbi:MAG: SPOR domain-containing protein, partial [Bacteroidota bacterium]